MSADNWAVCPRCYDKVRSNRAVKEEQLRTGYGILPLAEFDALRNELKQSLSIERTFREDYEIGLDTDTVKVVYKGSCTDCGLTLQFNDERVIPELEREREARNAH